MPPGNAPHKSHQYPLAPHQSGTATSWGSKSGSQQGSRRGSRSGQRGGQSRWRYRRRSYGYGAQGGASQWAVGIQACLAQLVGSWVPQNGIIGPRTRRAIQMFQGQQQLPVTGLLDQTTANAIQAACSGPAAGPPGDGAGPPPPPTPPGPPDAAAAADAPPPGDAPPDAGEAEIGAEAEQEAEQELRVDGSCQVQVEWHDQVPLAKDQQFSWAPDSPAVFVVYVSGKPWHVGVAKRSLRGHLLARARELRERKIPLASQAQRSLAWVSLLSGSAPRCAIQQGRSQDPAVPFRPIHPKHAMLKILKRFLVKTFQTEKKGNRVTDKVQFGPNGSITILYKGKQVAKLSASSQI
jgi:hypothetical protein